MQREGRGRPAELTRSSVLRLLYRRLHEGGAGGDELQRPVAEMSREIVNMQRPPQQLVSKVCLLAQSSLGSGLCNGTEEPGSGTSLRVCSPQSVFGHALNFSPVFRLTEKPAGTVMALPEEIVMRSHRSMLGHPLLREKASRVVRGREMSHPRHLPPSRRLWRCVGRPRAIIWVYALCAIYAACAVGFIQIGAVPVLPVVPVSRVASRVSDLPRRELWTFATLTLAGFGSFPSQAGECLCNQLIPINSMQAYRKAYDKPTLHGLVLLGRLCNLNEAAEPAGPSAEDAALLRGAFAAMAADPRRRRGKAFEEWSC